MGLITKIYKEFIQLNIQKKKKNSFIKLGEKIWIDIFPNRHTKANRYTKRCSTSLIIKEMQIKTTMKYCFTRVRMTIIIKTKLINVGDYLEKSKLLYFWWGHKLVWPLWITVWRFLKKLKRVLLYDPSISSLSIYLKKMKTLIWKDIYILVFTAAWITTVS